jgi:hypothetical protein
MSVTPDLSTAAPAPDLAAEIARVRASGVLGASGRLVELFEFLVACSLEGRSPKEAEIALAVFGKADAEALRDDPVARVYIHRLRKRFDEFYLRNGTTNGARLDIPKGDYRIVCVSPADVATPDLSEPQPDAPAAPLPAGKRWRWGLVAAALLVLAAGNVAAWAMLGGNATHANAVELSTPWRPMAEGTRPLTVVVGDYYMFGEYEDQVTLKRLIRDFSVNNKEDLARKQSREAGGFDRFSDVALQYLPASTAYALADIAPLLKEGRDVRVVLASSLEPGMLKTDDIIYVGLLSGLGALRDPVFARSLFQFGGSYDQLIDRKTGKSYMSEAFLAAPSDQMYRDYGFFATFEGPTGNRIAILSGTRDTAVMGVAEAMTQPDRIKRVEQATNRERNFEALFEVRGQKHVNLEAQVVASYPLDSAAIWSGGRANIASYPAQ